MRKVRLDPTRPGSRVFVTLIRIGMTIGCAFGVAVIATLVLTILELYLSGHGYPGLSSPLFWGMSAADLALLGAAGAAGLLVWWASGRMFR